MLKEIKEATQSYMDGLITVREYQQKLILILATLHDAEVTDRNFGEIAGQLNGIVISHE